MVITGSEGLTAVLVVFFAAAAEPDIFFAGATAGALAVSAGDVPLVVDGVCTGGVAIASNTAKKRLGMVDPFPRKES
jgi:hypothetical protein